MDARTSPFRARITQLREVLAREGIDALLVPSADPHLSEYLPERWQGRQWLSGFTGSVATLVVGRHAAALFADSRYWEQAERELQGSGIDLVRIASAAAPAHIDWICEHVPRGGTVAVGGTVGSGVKVCVGVGRSGATTTTRGIGKMPLSGWSRPSMPS